MHKQKEQSPGFTMVELVVVMVVIGILAAIVISLVNNAVYRAQRTLAKSDLIAINKILREAQINTSLSVRGIATLPPTVWDGEPAWNGGMSNGIDWPCPPDMRNVKMSDTSHGCVATYLRMLDRLEEINGTKYPDLRDGDPWGRPYVIDDEEGGSHEEECYSNDRVSSADKIGVRGDFNLATNQWYKQQTFPEDFPGLIIVIDRVNPRPADC